MERRGERALVKRDVRREKCGEMVFVVAAAPFLYVHDCLPLVFMHAVSAVSSVRSRTAGLSVRHGRRLAFRIRHSAFKTPRCVPSCFPIVNTNC